MKRPAIVIFCAAMIVTLAMGVRQSFGLFLPQMSISLDIGRSEFGLALAIQNLVFGLAQPFVGAIADKHGAGRVTLAGAAIYVAGLIGAAMASSALGLHVSFGLVVGVAMSATTFVVALGAVGRVVPSERRGTAFGLVTAGGSLGQFLVVPGAALLLGEFGYRQALIILAALVAICGALALGVAGKGAEQVDAGPKLSLGQALGEAAGHRGYWLLNLGFFVCGFHVAFLVTHLPAYLSDHGLGIAVGAQCLALIGLFNIFGSFVFGRAGDHMRQKYVLSGIYAGRGVVLVLFLLTPLTNMSALIFAAAMGFLWLGTVPLTSGIVGRIFGMRYLATLYGIVFLSHQVGSFFGAWAAGWLYDRAGNYDASWAASIGLAVLAALVHLPIKDSPIDRTPRPLPA